MLIGEYVSENKRGVHLQPFGHSGWWCGDAERRAKASGLMKKMRLSWCVLLNDGDSILTKFDGKEVVRWLIENGQVPIVRYYDKLPRHFTGQEMTRRYVSICEEYGVPALIQLWNEPFDSREWEGDAPSNAWEIFLDRWKKGAKQIIDLGGCPGFPDGPDYGSNPFLELLDVQWMFSEGHAWYGLHNYGKGRPVRYPFDAVSMFGEETTEEEVKATLGQFYDVPSWHDVPVAMMNGERRRLAKDPPAWSALTACWMSWAVVHEWAYDAFGHHVPMATTEGGWCPRDRAGSGWDCDLRWPHTTPEEVARKTLYVMEEESNPMFAICPWLLADSRMGGASGWEFDAWWGWAYPEQYPDEIKPVVHLLGQEFPEPPLPPEPEPPEPPLPDPEPPEDNWTRLSGKLDRIIELTESL